MAEYQAMMLRLQNRYYGTLPRPQVQCAKPQQAVQDTLDKEGGNEAGSSPRVIVRITGFKVRPLDPDNFAGGCKALIDQLRYSGLIKGDEHWRIKLETDQVKVPHYAEERTELEIIYP